MKTIQLETGGYQPKSRLVLLQCLVGLLFFTFVIRFWYLQIHRGADFAQQAQANHLRQESVYASRGLIRDVKGTLLAETGRLRAGPDPGRLRDISATLAQVSEWAGIPLEQLTNRFQQDRRKVKPSEPIPLLNDMPFDQVARIEAQLMHWPGLKRHPVQALLSRRQGIRAYSRVRGGSQRAGACCRSVPCPRRHGGQARA